MKILIIIFLLFSTLPGFAQTNWEQVNGPYGGRVGNIKVDENGFVYIDVWGTLYKSIDQGVTWNPFSVPLGEISPFDKVVTIFSDQKFVSISGRIYFIEPKSNQLIFNSNGYNLKVDSNNEIYKYVNGAGLFSSKDTAKTWQLLGFENEFVEDYEVYNDSVIFVATFYNLKRSIDDGKNWEEMLVYSYYAIDRVSKIFTHNNNLYIQTYPVLYISHNLGDSWENISKEFSQAFFIDIIDNEIFISTNSGLYTSSDNGATWNNLGFNQRVFAVQKDKFNNLYVGNWDGVFIKRENSAEWKKSNFGINGKGVSNIITQGNNVFVTAAIRVFRSQDSGISWVDTNMDLLHSEAFIKYDQKGRLIVNSYDGIMYSLDNGNTWSKIPSDKFHGYNISSMVTYDNKICVLTGEGKFYYSEDFGINWELIYSKNYIYNIELLSIDESGNILYSVIGELRKINVREKKENLLFVSDRYITELAIGSNGNYYIASRKYVYVRKRDDNWLNLGQDFGEIREIKLNKNNELFVITSSGIFKSSDFGKSFQKLHASSEVISFGFDESGNYYYGTTTHGLFKSYYENSNVSIPTVSFLSQNYPNPFNNETRIEFFINRFQNVEINIYDILGSRVTTLLSDILPAGYYDLNWNAANLSSGIYFCVFSTDDIRETKKMMLIK